MSERTFSEFLESFSPEIRDDVKKVHDHYESASPEKQILLRTISAVYAIVESSQPYGVKIDALQHALLLMQADTLLHFSARLYETLEDAPIELTLGVNILSMSTDRDELAEKFQNIMDLFRDDIERMVARESKAKENSNG